MGRLIGSANMDNFFDIMQKPVHSEEELIAKFRDAISCIEDDINVGRVMLQLSVKQSKLRAQSENMSCTLYHRPGLCGYKPVVFSFRTDDGDIINITFYPRGEASWDDEEKRDIHMVAYQLFMSFRLESVQESLKTAIKTDLSVGIPNVSGFMDFAARNFANKRLMHYVGIYFNIHNFKYVNKILPHENADEVMKIYAHRLLQELDRDEIVARLGGDNYVALIREENAERFFRIINDMEITYHYENETRKFHFSATIGASKMNEISAVGDVMLRISIAYQVARQLEKTEPVFFSEDFYADIMRQKEIIASFQRGLDMQEFVIHYQPKVNSYDKTICGAEALVRWSTQGRMIFPCEFIPILEKDGSICRLDFYVLERTCELLHECMANGLKMPRISINFSRKHIGNPDLAREIVQVIDKHKVPHQFIEIELTESEDFKDYVVMAELIRQLKEAGISTSIDDFGTGYSSLNMLKMTEIDVLKIDRSFIPEEEDYEKKSKDCIMFENIANLAKNLGYKVVVEGVETQQQFDYLKGVGCDIVQGFFFDKPLPVDKFLKRIAIGKYE